MTHLTTHFPQDGIDDIKAEADLIRTHKADATDPYDGDEYAIEEGTMTITIKGEPKTLAYIRWSLVVEMAAERLIEQAEETGA